jgi:hypothetical protein
MWVTVLAEAAWLVDASYEGGHVTLSLIRAKDLEPFRWVDSNFHPYYLSEHDADGQPIKKVDLFSQNEHTLYKVNVTRDALKNVVGYELEIDPALGYVYDKGLRFGLLHRLEHGAWVPSLVRS